jgi:hypothetical protein
MVLGPEPAPLRPGTANRLQSSPGSRIPLPCLESLHGYHAPESLTAPTLPGVVPSRTFPWQSRLRSSLFERQNRRAGTFRSLLSGPNAQNRIAGFCLKQGGQIRACRDGGIVGDAAGSLDLHPLGVAEIRRQDEDDKLALVQRARESAPPRLPLSRQASTATRLEIGSSCRVPAGPGPGALRSGPVLARAGRIPCRGRPGSHSLHPQPSPDSGERPPESRAGHPGQGFRSAPTAA